MEINTNQEKRLVAIRIIRIWTMLIRTGAPWEMFEMVANNYEFWLFTAEELSDLAWRFGEKIGVGISNFLDWREDKLFGRWRTPLWKRREQYLKAERERTRKRAKIYVNSMRCHRRRRN